jgi:hypothetical protein
MKCTTFAAILYLTGNLAHGGDGAKPPEAWEGGIRTKHQEVWDHLRKDDGKVSASEVIEWIYKNWRSKHDGDSQLSAAMCLVQLDDDPLPHLKKMMAETSPERRAYAALVAGMLGDSRLKPDLEKLSDDHATLGQFEDDWFWKTVSEAAKVALRSLSEGGVAGVMRAEGQFVSAWLPKEKKKAESGRGDGIAPVTPPTPPDMRVRIRRFQSDDGDRP